MVFFFTIFVLGILVWAISIGIEANIRADAALRQLDHEEAKQKAPQQRR